MIKMYTDGACLGNPGPGGWGVVIYEGEQVTEHAGSEKHTTNNRMELMAAIEGLALLGHTTDVELITDSQYVQKGIQSWLAKWVKNGWKTAQGKPVKNQDLWEKLAQQVSRHRVKWTWVKGHAGTVGNERADTLANRAAHQQ